MEIQENYQHWLREAPELRKELQTMDAADREDAFYRHLTFGTGGLRGVLGAGTNRMNRYTVARATQGLCNYLNSHFEQPVAVIGYDSRIKSDDFARTAAEVFAANGVKVHIWPRLNPVPTVSFAVRELGANIGVMITASHNPAKYNGYKVYGSDGCQITTAAAEIIYQEIEKLDYFSGVKLADYDAAQRDGRIQDIPNSMLDAFLRAVNEQSVLYGDKIDRDFLIVYSPLNGSGLIPVTRVLRESGFSNVFVVPEQEQPDGSFPTCPYPNPEVREALKLSLEYAEELGAQLVLATDPDCDRVGIAVRDGEEMKLLSGNEVGLLLLDFICSQRSRHEKMPEHPVAVKTIVTTDLAERVAAHYGVQLLEVLTGFKYIGEKIGLLERMGRAEDFIFGFEESYGYLSGQYIRDKDGVGAALLICEMFAWYQSHGVGLADRLQAIYREYGYCLNILYSYAFEGPAGFQKMNEIMRAFRCAPKTLGGKKVIECFDYSDGIYDMPPSNVLRYELEDQSSVVIRPSGTEPKLKIYISVQADGRNHAEKIKDQIKNDIQAIMKDDVWA